MEPIIRDFTPMCRDCNNLADYAIDVLSYVENRTSTNFHLWLFNIYYRDNPDDIWKCKKCLFKTYLNKRNLSLSYYTRIGEWFPPDWYNRKMMAWEEACLTISAAKRYVKTI